jgi:phage-related protein
MDKTPSLKPLYWVGSSKRDLLSLPKPVVDLFGFALCLTQDGRKHEQAAHVPKEVQTRNRHG